MLGDRLRQHDAQCWLVNTGWTGGAFGTGPHEVERHARHGQRSARWQTRKTCGIRDRKTHRPQHSNLLAPTCPAKFCIPCNAWADKHAYDAQAQLLAAKFEENFRKFDAPEEVRNAGPHVKK